MKFFMAILVVIGLCGFAEAQPRHRPGNPGPLPPGHGHPVPGHGHHHHPRWGFGPGWSMWGQQWSYRGPAWRYHPFYGWYRLPLWSWRN